MKTFLSLTFSSSVPKQTGAVGVAAFQNHVGNELFERGVGFYQTSWAKRLIFAVKNGRKVSVDIGLESGKRAELVKQLCRNYKNFFVFGHLQMRFRWGLLKIEELPLAKQGSLAPLISDTIHGLAKADYSLFVQFATTEMLRCPCIAFNRKTTPFLSRLSIKMRALFSPFFFCLGFSAKVAAILLTVGLFEPNVLAQERPLSASRLFPPDTQALFSLPNSEAFLAGWNNTQLGKLAADEKLKDFWATQRKEIQDRFSEAGWQLSLEIEDLNDIAGGQTSLGWISRPNIEAKPFSIAMVIDVVNRSVPAEKFLQRIDAELKTRKAKSSLVVIAGIKVAQYTIPKTAGEVRANESFYAISKDQLIATDDLITMTELLGAQSATKTSSLANEELYKQVQSKIQDEQNEPEIEYFVRPIGFAKLLRSISGKQSVNKSDILAILDREGFGDLQCVAGNLQISNNPFDFFHHGYMVSKKPSATAVQILDFPNVIKLITPDWINKESASVLSFSWNVKEAFPKFKSIVDALVGAGGFDDMIKGMRDDPQGPQIDIIKDVLPYLTTEFHVVTEIVKPVSPDSKRSMVILKLVDKQMKLPSILKRYAEGEPNSKPIDFEGNRIWSFENKEETEIELDFGVNQKGKAEEAKDEPLLDKWAITIFGEYFIFASDVEMIKDAILRAKNDAAKNGFEKESDVAKVTRMLEDVSGNEGRSMNQITRSDRAFEMQYELFRQDILPESRSMMASILDKILKPKDPRKTQVQRVKGDKLPTFDKIKDYFTPSGGVIRTEEDGWSIQSFILSK